MTRCPTAVAVALTSGCNLRCAYCYQRRGPVERMPWPVLRGAIETLLAGGAAEPELAFYGGEPLLELPLIRRAIGYLDDRAPPGVTPRYRLVTNGTLLDARAIRLLALRRVRTLISFDGVEPAQRLRGEDTFAALDALLRRVARDWPGWLEDDVTIAMTLTSASLDHLAESVRYLLGLGVSAIQLSPLATHDAAWDGGCFGRLDAQIREAAAACRDHLRRTGEMPFLPFRRTSGRGGVRGDGWMCRIADGHAVSVDVDGQAVACDLLARSWAAPATDLGRRAADAARLGPITDPDLPGRLARCRGALAALGLFDGKERKRSPYQACAGCPVRSSCRVCPLAIANLPGNENPDTIPPLPCAFYSLVARYRRRFPATRSPSSWPSPRRTGPASLCGARGPGPPRGT
jgi:sulfatase maturation enzyme AslB (radical SAM superfamily)